jgi:hypothetical protein
MVEKNSSMFSQEPVSGGVLAMNGMAAGDISD